MYSTHSEHILHVQYVTVLKKMASLRTLKCQEVDNKMFMREEHCRRSNQSSFKSALAYRKKEIEIERL
jgi:hypothetical protein